MNEILNGLLALALAVVCVVFIYAAIVGSAAVIAMIASKSNNK